MIAGLEEITEGTILIDGKVVNNVPPRDRDIAMVFQNYALYPHMDVRENMAFGLKLRKFDKREIAQRVGEAAEILELQDMLDRKPKALSGGQRQRVALGRAIVRKPKVFLFDEPLSNLDAKLRGQMRAEIAKLHQRLDATVVYVTHDQVEAMTMGSKIVVMKDGVVHQIDDPVNLYRNPNNRFVAGFIGAPSMNFTEGGMTNGEFASGKLSCRFSPERLRGVTGETVVIGVRPEDLRAGTGESGEGSLEGEVELIEPLGSETYVHLADGGTKYIARLESDQKFVVGEIAHLHFNPDKSHLFDVESGLTIR